MDAPRRRRTYSRAITARYYHTTGCGVHSSARLRFACVAARPLWIFAEKIGANPASLITVLFHLGEMATQTQSLDEETFELLGAELGYVVKIVSPEDEERELLESLTSTLKLKQRRKVMTFLKCVLRL